MPYVEFYSEWLEHDGKRVKLNGITHVIKVDVYQAIYPHPHETMIVHAEVVNKKSKYYQDRKAEYGDDWSTDVLSSDVMVQAEILHQLQEN